MPTAISGGYRPRLGMLNVRRSEKPYTNDDGVTMTAHLAFDSWNVDAVGCCVDGHGHRNRVGRVHGHDPFFHIHGRGREYSPASRENGRGQSLSGPSYQVRNAWSHIVCRRDDNHLVLARPRRSERDRGSPYNEDDSRVGKCRVGEDGGEGIYEESAGDDLGEGQSQAWVEVEEWKTLAALVCPLFLIHVRPANTLSPRLSSPVPLDSLGPGQHSSSC